MAARRHLDDGAGVGRISKPARQRPAQSGPCQAALGANNGRPGLDRRPIGHGKRRECKPADSPREGGETAPSNPEGTAGLPKICQDMTPDPYFFYNGDGRKVAETVTQSGAPTTTTHLVDELNPTGY